MLKHLFLIGLSLLCGHSLSWSQGLHFSQINSAPLLLSPAHTALIPDADFRLGANYRTQWSQVPVNYNTMSAFADFKFYPSEVSSNFLGVGAAFFSDQAGDGVLSLNQFQLSVAYHVNLDDNNMVSVGLGAAYIQRTIDFDRLSYDLQWNGFEFDKNNANGEAYRYEKTSYPDFAGGISYAYIPHENMYLRAGVGFLHVNRPKQSFYNKDLNLGLRPTFNFEGIVKLNNRLIFNPTLYGSFQKKAYELVLGSLISYNLTPDMSKPTVFVTGLYYRWNDAVVALAGLDWNNVRLQFSSDITASGMSAATHGFGAFEMSLIFKGFYNGSRTGHGMDSYTCPRF